MPMCKKCKEVFGVAEIQEGFCKSCYTPELVDEEQQNLETKKNSKRPVLIGIISTTGIFLTTIMILFIIVSLFKSTFLSNIGAIETMVSIGLASIVLAAYIGLHNMKKWGAYMIILIHSFNIIWRIIILSKSSYMYPKAMIPIFLSMVIVFVVIYYMKKMK